MAQEFKKDDPVQFLMIEKQMRYEKSNPFPFFVEDSKMMPQIEKLTDSCKKEVVSIRDANGNIFRKRVYISDLLKLKTVQTEPTKKPS